MVDALLTQKLQQILDDRSEYYLELANYFWKNWDGLVQKQSDYARRQVSGSIWYCPYDFLPKKLCAKVIYPGGETPGLKRDSDLKSLDDLLRRMSEYRRCPEKPFVLLTRRRFLDEFCEFFKLDEK